MTTAKVLRKTLRERDILVPYVVGGLQALMAQSSGCSAVYMTGFGAASALGLPDVGLVTMTQMCEQLRAITATSELPVIVDADTGYGNHINVAHTVREYERAGAASLHLEDQLWPKRCGYMAGKQVISKEEAVNKIKAAVDARRDPDFLIIARSDALAVSGWNEVEDRIKSYITAGADMAFVDGIKNLEDLKNYNTRLAGIPLLFNNVPMIPMKKLKSLGDFKIVLNPFAMSNAWAAYENALKQMLADDLPDANEIDQNAFNHIINILGAPKYFKLDQKYSTTGTKIVRHEEEIE